MQLSAASAGMVLKQRAECYKSKMITQSVLLVVALAAVLTAATPSPNGTATSGPVLVSRLAPADEYFGSAHLSPIVIRHRVFALKDDLHHMREQPDAIEHDALAVQDAISDWSEKYPRDPWIAAAFWNLATLYEELPGQDAQKNAVQTLTLVRNKYAGSDFARYAQRDLDRGVGIRAWPRWANESAPTQPAELTATILLLRGPHGAVTSESQLAQDESQFWQKSHNGEDPAYARAAWELASMYERLRGPDARQHAIRLLALLVDRFPNQVYGTWAMRDLERGVGVR